MTFLHESKTASKQDNFTSGTLQNVHHFAEKRPLLSKVAEIFRIFTNSAGNFEAALAIFLKSSCIICRKIREWRRKVFYDNLIFLHVQETTYVGNFLQNAT